MSWFRHTLSRLFPRTPRKSVSRARRPEVVRLDDRITPASDLQLSVAGNPFSGVAGTNVTFTYSLTNVGPDDATDVELAETLPAGFSFVSIAQTGGVADVAFTLDPNTDNIVSSTVATFPAGKTVTFEVVAKLNANVADGTTLSRNLAATSSSAEATPADNKAKIDTNVTAEADVGISIAGPVSGVAGGTLLYTVTVTNNGPSDAKAVDFNTAVSSKLSVKSTVFQSGTALPDVLTPGSSSVYLVTVGVANNTPDGNQTVTVTSSTGTFDPATANDSKLVTIAIEARSLSASVAAGVLTIADVGGKANDLSITRVGANFVITDTTEKFSAGVGSLSNGDSTLTIAAAGITGIVFNTGSGDDTLTVDTTTALGVSVNFDGGTESDEITIVGGAGQTVTSNFVNGNSGSVVVGAAPAIAYSNLEPVLLDFGDGTNYIFNLPAAASTAFFEDNGVLGDGIVQLRSSAMTFETTTFNESPAGSVTINRGNAADELVIAGPVDFLGSLTAGSTAKPFAKISSVGDGYLTGGSIALAADTIDIAASLLGDTSLTLVGTTVTQTAKVMTLGTLTLGGVGNAGTYTLTNAANDVGTLTSAGAATISFTDANGLIVGPTTATTEINLVVGGTATQSGPITTAGTLTLGGVGNGGTYTLTNAANDVGTLTSAGAASISFTDANNLTVAATTATTGIALSVGGTATQSGPITTAGTLTLGGVGNGGTYTLTNAANDVGTLTSAGAGLISFVDTNNVIVGPTSATTGVGLAVTGTATQSGPISTGILSLGGVGNGGTYTLTNAANNAGTLTSAGAASISFTDANNLIVAATTATTGIALVVGGTATQTGPITTVGTLTLGGVGNGGTYTLTNAANNAGTLTSAGAASISFTDANNLIVAATTATTGIALSVGGTATQTGPITTAGTLSLGGVGNGGTYTLTNAANDVGTLTSAGSAAITFNDTNTLTIGNVTTAGALTASSDESMTVAGNVNANSATLTAGEAFTSLPGTTIAATGNVSVTSVSATTIGGDINAGSATLTAGGDLTTQSGSSITTTAGLTASADQSIVVSGGVNAGGNTAFNAGNDFTLSPGQTITVAAGKTFGITVDQIGAADAAGGTVTFAGADFIAPGGVTITGGADSDTFNVTKTTAALTIDGGAPAAAPGDTIAIDAEAGTYDLNKLSATSFSLGTGGTVTYSNIETVTYTGVLVWNVIGTNGKDTLILVTNASNNAEYTLNADPTIELPATVTTFRFSGLNDQDRMFVTAKAGQLPVTAISFDGGADSDGLSVNGNGENVNLTLSPGLASVVVGVTKVTAVDLGTGIDIFNSNTVSIGSTENLQNITLAAGVDFVQDAVVKAVVISDPTVDSLAVWKNTTISLNTASPVPADDTVTITSTGPAADHLNKNLTITTDATAASQIAVTGAVDVSENVTLTSSVMSVSGSITAGQSVTATAKSISVTANVTAGQAIALNNSGTLSLGTATLQAGTTFTQSAGPVVILDAKSATVTAGGNVSFAGAIDSAVAGTGSLTVNTPATGSFAQSLGGSAALNAFTTNELGSTVLNGAVVKTKGTQSFGDATTFAVDGTRFEASAGNITFNNTLNPTVAGKNLVTAAPGFDITHTGAIGGTNAVGTYTIENARNVSLNGLTAGTLQQSTGTGTSTLGGTVTLTGGTAGTASYTGGGAINLKTNTAAFTGTVSAANAPIVLQLANGATQPGGSLATTQLYLTGDGVFTLNQPTNTLSSGTAGEFFAKLNSGSFNVTDKGTLYINFFDAASAEAITVNSAAISKFASQDLVVDPGATRKNDQLINMTAAGTIRFDIGLNRAANETSKAVYVAQANAKLVTIGQPLAEATVATTNLSKDTFTIRPNKNAEIFIYGNAPLQGNADKWVDSLIPDFTDIPSATFVAGVPGSGTYTFPAVYQPLSYESIEGVGGKQAQVFTVQTGPTTTDRDPNNPTPATFSISMRYFQSNADLKNQLTGDRIVSNAFIVNPSRVDPTQPFGAPTVTFAYITNKRGEGAPDLVLASGANSQPVITIVRASAIESSPQGLNISALSDSQILAQFSPFEGSFYGGFSVAADDFNGDGRDELVIGAGRSGGPRVSVFRITDDASKSIFDRQSVFTIGGQALNFFPYESSFRGGVNVATVRLPGDNVPDIVVGSGFGGAPRVRVFDGSVAPQMVPNTDQTFSTLDFFAYDSSLRGGVLVAGGKFDAQERIITAPAAGGGPHIKIFATNLNPLNPNPVYQFFAWDPTSTLIGNDTTYQNGIGSIALATSSDNSGSNRELLLTRPKGQVFEIIRFGIAAFDNKTDTNVNGLFRTANYQNTFLDQPNVDYSKLTDSGFVGGASS